jgi:hypothetical protein
MASALVYKVYNDVRPKRTFAAAFASSWDCVVFALSISREVTVKYQGRIVWNNHTSSTNIGSFNDRLRHQHERLAKKVNANHAKDKAKYERLYNAG